MIIASLVGTPAPTAVLAGVLSIALFAIVGLIVGPNFDGVNAPAIGSSQTKKDDRSKKFNQLS